MHLRPPPLATSAAPRVLVVGAGVGGLCAAARLAHQGLDVQVLERSAAPGGKMGQVWVDGQALDSGPTVLTMRWVFDALFDSLGQSLDRHLALQPCAVLARHRWGANEQLDLSADLATSLAAIESFSSAAEAARYAAFCERAETVYRTLLRSFLCNSLPTPLSLTWRVLREQGLAGLGGLLRMAPFTTLWRALGQHFADPRLQQLFGRYATYCGTSPFNAPATLMLVAHVEREAVWQVPGGLHRLAQVLARCAQQQGARLRYGCEVQRLLLHDGRVSGVALANGETLQAEAVLFNGDAQALGQGLLGPALREALGRPVAPAPSLSALTWHLQAQTQGMALSHHNVFFAPPAGYRGEFDAIAQGRLPADPTVYLCAQDRQATAGDAPHDDAPERLMLLVNAPPQSAGASLSNQDIATCEQRMWARLQQAGLNLRPTGQAPVLTTPQDFAARFPGSHGALYGPASPGWRASFQARPDGRTPVPGLYLAGGTVHPGPGVPMAALSGQRAAALIAQALASTRRFHPVLTPGGTWTR